MFIRILFLAVISLQISGCIATPRIFSQVVDDYEPPVKTQQKEKNPNQDIDK